MKLSSAILRTLVMALALAGATRVLFHIFSAPVSSPPRREYELELRYALTPPEAPQKKAKVRKKEQQPRSYKAIPARFRSLIIEKAQKYGFPPELIAGIIARESSFDPGCTAPDGGRGLMQLMPSVCREQKCADPFDPAANIEAGTAHLARMMDYFSNIPDGAERIKFALAAYNGGPGHVIDARSLARKFKLDPDKWQGNVEESIQFLKFRSFWKKARHGYCNADIVVSYVNAVLALAERYSND